MNSPPSVPPELLDKSLPELLVLIRLGEIAKDKLEWAIKRVKELWNKREYGFTPEPELASKLQRISKSDAYKRMRECIGKHRFLGLVKLGLRIEELSAEGSVKIIAKIKDDVYQKFGTEGIKILRMGSTGALIEVIRYLSDFKIEHNYSQADMATIFESIVDKWTAITIFHETEYGQSALGKTIITYMQSPHEFFFVFASGDASTQAKRAIASLSNDSIIRTMGYIVNLHSRKEDLTGRELYAWHFRKIS